MKEGMKDVDVEKVAIDGHGWQILPRKAFGNLGVQNVFGQICDKITPDLNIENFQ
jgi:hypothetical protein